MLLLACDGIAMQIVHEEALQARRLEAALFQI